MKRLLRSSFISSVPSHLAVSVAAVLALVVTACNGPSADLSDGRTSFVADAHVATADAPTTVDGGTPDALVVSRDAQLQSPDAAIVTVDAAVAASDALLPVDAAHNVADAAVTTIDAAHNVADAAITTIDAPTAPSSDARASAPDARATSPDAHTGGSSDARTSAPDAAPSPFAGGDGTLGNPFLIANSLELSNATDPQYSAASFKLIADVDLTNIAFTPFGDFGGTFDGGHHRVSNWNYSGFGCVGFFSSLSGLVHDLVLESPILSGTDNAYVGALVGCDEGGLMIRDQVIGGLLTSDYYAGGLLGVFSNDGPNISGIASCSSSAATVAPYAGGLAGDNGDPIVDSYATGEANGSAAAGGLVAYNMGFEPDTVVLRSYSSGRVDSDTGGLLGFSWGYPSFDSFWNVDTSNQSTSAGGTGLSDDEMRSASNFPGWDFSSVWQLEPGQAPTLRDNGNVSPLTAPMAVSPVGATPFEFALGAYDFDGDALTYAIITPPTRGTLSALIGNRLTYTADSWSGYTDSMTYQVTDSHGVASPVTTITITVQPACNQSDPGFADGGNGSADTPYVVKSVPELQLVHAYMYCNYTLGSDLDLAGVSFSPIGAGGSFAGPFDGNNHQIKNWTYSSNDGSETGFFASTSGPVKNLRLVNENISGSGATGGMVANANAALTNDFTSGTVTSTGSAAGGLVGNVAAPVSSCGSSATVKGLFSTGGLIGFASSYQISHSFATGDVTSTDAASAAGGLIGLNQFGGIDTSYATGAVTSAQGYAGGLVGYDNLLVNGYSDVTDSYATGSASGGLFAGALVGFAEIQESATLARVFAIGQVIDTSGSAQLAGLIGGLQDDGNDPSDFTMTDALWDLDTTQQAANITGGSGQSDSAMKSQSTYTDFDFATVWTIAASSYPTLR